MTQRATETQLMFNRCREVRSRTSFARSTRFATFGVEPARRPTSLSYSTPAAHNVSTVVTSLQLELSHTLKKRPRIETSRTISFYPSTRNKFFHSYSSNMAQRPPLTFENFTSRRHVLEKLFDCSLTPTAAAEQLANATVAEEESLNDGLEITWACVLVAAREKPEMQEKLVELLQAMVTLPAPKGEKADVWQELPGLGMEFNHEWNALEIAQDGKKRQDGIDAFVHINQFAAKLFEADSRRFDYSMFALWTMRDALESTVSHRNQDTGPLDAFLPAAAAWIDLAGKSLRQCKDDFPPDRGANPGKGGPLWEGKHGFCHERWSLWQKRFDELASDSQLSQSLRETARKADEQMRKLS
ncbi:hypothetical protein HII31_10866 [Pseudocercospora fuligena]|uniref:Uncharacterized protein n=1 Tax=Pseudocercospora fuligena TaxID=685502 RepID=A0A8H6R8K7_9PEZI|nr:hypothetical protein HII31_10866 [Pseudocercospora fuligena]